MCADPNQSKQRHVLVTIKIVLHDLLINWTNELIPVFMFKMNPGIICWVSPSRNRKIRMHEL
jgi:hypothetical protein